MKQLILLCSNMYIEAFAHYITTTFQQDDGLPGLSIVWYGKTARHEIGLIVIEGETIPERLQDMIYTARDLFDFTEVFEGLPASRALPAALAIDTQDAGSPAGVGQDTLHVPLRHGASAPNDGRERLTAPWVDLCQETQELLALLDRESAPWSSSVMISQLHNEVGTLSALVKDVPPSALHGQGRRDVQGAIADVLLVLLRAAASYDIDVLQAYHHMLVSTREVLEQELAASPAAACVERVGGEEEQG